ncbi:MULTISPECIES: hypothetical protein [unclassified Halomonas]|uniref:hypothetical protein n=1 Tax=unclassified Halomonas TaxID=2609666 RepID=UPI0007D9B49D|nr:MULTISPECIES: hypothetical protein [unclassified Halomonas]MBT2788024.1 hypothetical protein [Halomonas sp. ISL-106]MBT2795773.1 hypothetical protein [Halomonas sp. ISL-104]OAL61066.1 hypothetical protein A6R74_15800 [Halomonas sp. ALS9]
MLNPKTERVDYGLELRPPEGYELDSAMAATYTLDLDALLSVPVALCFHDTLEGEIQGERLALLEAIGQLNNRLKVFYQAGKIKLPSSYNRLFALLEPWLQPVMPGNVAYSSFHPKFWLLRYTAPKLPVRYRLIVLSRNLTFDRSWDLAVSLDGEVSRESIYSAHQGWDDLVRDLLLQDTSFEPGKVIRKELGRINWYPPENFRDPRILAGGPEYGQPLDMLNSNDSILVVSPFLKDSIGGIGALDEFAQRVPVGSRWLISRGEELDAIGPEKLEGWSCFSINSDVVEGEERLELGTAMQNLHAKLIVVERGQTCHWHLGSANSTAAALGTAGHDPRNTELMVRLTGKSTLIGPAALLEQWVNRDNPGNGLFVEHQFEERSESEGETERNLFRVLSFDLIKANWTLYAREAESDPTLFELELQIDEIPTLPESLSVEVALLPVKGSDRSLGSVICWKNLNINQLSAFLAVKITSQASSETEHLVIQTALNLPPGTDRERRMIEQLVDTEDKFLNYIRLLLQRHPDKNEWFGFDSASGQFGALATLFGDSPIFEQLMLAAARDTEALERIQKMIDRLEGTSVPVPERFVQLWRHFAPKKR